MCFFPTKNSVPSQIISQMRRLENIHFFKLATISKIETLDLFFPRKRIFFCLYLEKGGLCPFGNEATQRKRERARDRKDRISILPFEPWTQTVGEWVHDLHRTLGNATSPSQTWPSSTSFMSSSQLVPTNIKRSSWLPVVYVCVKSMRPFSLLGPCWLGMLVLSFFPMHKPMLPHQLELLLNQNGEPPCGFAPPSHAVSRHAHCSPRPGFSHLLSLGVLLFSLLSISLP